jgi:hypothetical protein
LTAAAPHWTALCCIGIAGCSRPGDGLCPLDDFLALALQSVPVRSYKYLCPLPTAPHCTTPDYSNSSVNLSDIIGASLPCLVCKQLNLVITCWHLTSLPRVARDSPRRTLTRRAWQRQAQAPRLPLTTRWKPARTLCLAGRQRGTCGVRVGTHRRSGKSLLDGCDWVQSHLSREYMALYI